MESGRSVVIFGLQQRPELNGGFGKLISYDAAVDRWAVQVGDENLRIRSTNLTLHGDIVLMPPEDLSDVMGSVHLESAGPVIVTHSQQTTHQPAEIVKHIQDAHGQRWQLSWAVLRANLEGVFVGTSKKEMESNLKQGIYVGLNLLHFKDPSKPLCCVFVGDEWVEERRKLQEQNDAMVQALTFDTGSSDCSMTTNYKKLPRDRMFNMGNYTMTLKNRPLVSYFAIVKPGKNNCEAHLLPMVLTDTHYTCLAVAIYAKIFLE